MSDADQKVRPMKKVLIITYYWPPAGGPGVQRILKFVRYLPEFGWQPIILTPKQGEYPAVDHSLVQEIPADCMVVKTGSLEPGGMYRRITGMKRGEAIPIAVLAETEKLSRRKKISRWVRANLFIPDAKIGWMPFALAAAKNIFKDQAIDLILSSSPPPTAHLIAKKLSKRYKVKWVADFRDPWTDIHYYKYLSRLGISLRFDEKLERSVLGSADWITSVSKTYLENYKSKVNHERYSFIPNGYDREDLKDVDFTRYPEKFRISSIGTLNDERNPSTLFQAVRKIIKTNSEFADQLEIELVGIVSGCVDEDIVRNGLEKYVRKTPYLPHMDALQKMAGAWILLLPINKVAGDLGILTGKLFEYIGSGRTILGFGDLRVEAARFVKDLNTGAFFDYGDVEGTERFLLDQFQTWQKGTKPDRDNAHLIRQYERKSLTGQLAQLFDRLIIKPGEAK